MKQVIIFSLLLILSESIFSQKVSLSHSITSADYLKKSKNQKAVAWSLLGGGIGITIIGFGIASKGTDIFSYQTSVGLGISLAGLGTAVCSIPFFIASGINKRYARNKSFDNKTTAWILFCSGISLMAVSFIPFSSYDDANAVFSFGLFDFSIPLIVGGGITTLCSIPFFIAAVKDKQKSMSLSFKNEKAPQIQKSSFVFKSVPSLTLKINL